MRRKKDALTPIEYSIINAAVRLHHHGGEFYGFQIAKEIEDEDGARRLTGLGTLYRALDRLEQQGFFIRRWEDPTIAAQESRPRRRLYQVTGKAVLIATTATSTIDSVPTVMVLGEASL
jgi:PadR family transcriptional regulator PadR